MRLYGFRTVRRSRTRAFPLLLALIPVLEAAGQAPDSSVPRAAAGPNASERAGSLCELWRSSQGAVARGLALYERSTPEGIPPVVDPGFIPPANLLKELNPFLDAFQALVRSPDYSLELFAGAHDPAGADAPRESCLRSVGSAVLLMRLRILDQARRGESGELLESSADCFRAARVSPSASALCLWYGASMSAYAASHWNAGLGPLFEARFPGSGGVPRTAEQHLFSDELEEQIRGVVFPAVRELEKRLTDIIHANPGGKSDNSLRGTEGENPDLAWFRKRNRGPSYPSELAMNLKVARVKTTFILEGFPDK